MMNFKNFEVLYGNALKMKSTAAKIKEMFVRITIQQAAQEQMDLLKKQFVANFPSNMKEAELHLQFEAEQFFDLLYKWPELDVDRAKVRSLLTSMEDNGIEIPKSAAQIILSYAFNPE